MTRISRRECLKTTAAIAAGICLAPTTSRANQPGDAIDLASRRELFVDDCLIDRLDGARLLDHKPEPRDVAITCDAPWEGNTSAYFTLFEDGGRFHMYYRGSHFDEKTRKGGHPEVTCYATSADGINWTKPTLRLHEFNGSRENNIVLTGGGCHNFAPFKDTNPACPPHARFKALAGGESGERKKKPCLYAYQSADGVSWSRISDKPVITDGAFDSQNIAFWDEARGEYRAYWRYFTAGVVAEGVWKPAGVRAIRTATSKDFVTWTHQADLTYGDAPAEHLYTNAVRPYFRAPHLLIGFPTRYQPKTQQVEPVFMSSRDRVSFRRWPEALIPITAPKDRDGNRSNYMAHGLLPVPGNDRELSVYGTEAYYAGPGSRLRRFTFRTDGFVSVNAKLSGQLLTKPLRFTGHTLQINSCAPAGGSVRVEIRDAGGNAIRGFSLADCQPITGDSIAHGVKWTGNASLAALAGKPVRLCFALERADLYSLQFT